MIFAFDDKYTEFLPADIVYRKDLYIPFALVH